MGLLTNLLSGERRSLADPQPFITQMLNRGSQTSSGVWVNPDTAIRYTAVYAAVRIISESIASLPLRVYRRLDNGGKEQAANHPLFNVLHNLPNEWQTSFEWREMMTAHTLLRGNGYSRIDRGGDGRVIGLIPLHPDRVKPYRRENGSVWYEFRPIQGEIQQFAASEIFHLRGLSADGISGISPIALAREAVGLGMAAEEYQSRFFSNDATPPAYIKHPQTMREEAHKRLKQSWQEMYSGLPNVHKMAILEEGMDIKTVGMSNRDSQFLETRRFQISEIARLFRVPPHMLADLDRATYSNIEQQGLEFLTYTLAPWIARWEQAIMRDLFTPKGRGSYFASFVVRPLLMGDMGARANYLATMRQWGFLSANEGREMEDFNPRDDAGGPAFLEPLNMVEQGNAGPKQTPAAPGTGAPVAPPSNQPDDDEVELNALRTALRSVCSEQASRLISKEIKALKRLADKHPSAASFTREAETFYRDQFLEAPAEYVHESRRQLAAALGSSDLSAAVVTIGEWANTRGLALTDLLFDRARRN